MSTKRRAYLTEMKTQFTLAVPALLAQIAMVSMGFVDMVMTGRVGAVDMAAVALAGSLWVPLILFGQGLLLAVTPCVAQLRGAGSMRSGEHMQGVGHVMRQGIWMALFISVPLIIIVYLISFHLADMGVEGSLGLMTGQYLRAIIWARRPTCCSWRCAAAWREWLLCARRCSRALWGCSSTSHATTS